MQTLAVDLRVAHGDVFCRFVGEGEAVDAQAVALLCIVVGKDSLDDALLRQDVLQDIGVLRWENVEGSLTDGVLLKLIDTNAVGGESIVAGFHKNSVRFVRVARCVVKDGLKGEWVGVVVHLLRFGAAA